MSCFNCRQRVEVNAKVHCSCLQVFYCSTNCESQHRQRHSPNCIPSTSSLHALFDACFKDVFPTPCVDCDYGFSNLRKFHRNVRIRDGVNAETILLGLYKVIWRDVGCREFPEDEHYILNSIGASKWMILEAYEGNALDEFIQRYVRNVIDRLGSASPQCCRDWIENKLVIGPTRWGLSEEEWLTGKQIVAMRADVHQRYYV